MYLNTYLITLNNYITLNKQYENCFNTLILLLTEIKADFM